MASVTKPRLYDELPLAGLDGDYTPAPKGSYIWSDGAGDQQMLRWSDEGTVEKKGGLFLIELQCPEWLC